MSEELKPCPFCGNRNLHYCDDNDPRGGTWLFISCNQCGAMSRGIEIATDDDLEEHKKSREKAKPRLAKRWNERFSEKWSSGPPTEPGFYVTLGFVNDYPVALRLEKIDGRLFIKSDENELIPFRGIGFPVRWLKFNLPEVPQ